MYRILIVEDEEFARQALICSIEMIYPDQFEILSTDNGLHALDLCQQNDPHILLVDLNIPGISGLNLIRTLNDCRFAGKMIIITAYNRSKYIREALSLGVSDYLLKPVDLTLLQSSVDKCLTQLQEQNTVQETKLDSLFSYTQSYLIHDILDNTAPAAILSSAFGWPADGQLCACLFNWHPEKKLSDQQSGEFMRLAASLFSPGFLMLSAAIQSNLIFFLQTKSGVTKSEAEVIRWIYTDKLRENFSRGALMATPFVSTYRELYRTSRDCLFLAERTPDTFFTDPVPCQNTWTPDDRFRIRQKFVQRLRERQTDQLIQYLKRKYETTDDFWPWAAVFIEAVRYLDRSISPDRLLPVFQSRNPFILLEHWLNTFYSAHPDSGILSAANSKSEQAAMLIRKSFQQDLSQEEAAMQLGLTPTYFSNLFKKETGKSFPQYLAEYRISHAVDLILSGEEDPAILTSACGFHNKKYFLESFKKYSGSSFTQFLQTCHIAAKEENP